MVLSIKVFPLIDESKNICKCNMENYVKLFLRQVGATEQFEMLR